MNIKHFIYLIVVVMFVSGCGSSEKNINSKPSLSNTNTSLQSANTKNLIIRPKYEIYHLNDSVSELYFRLNSNELLYKKTGSETFTSNCVISYQLLKSVKSNDIYDSASVKLIDSIKNNEHKYLTGKLTVKAARGIQGYLKITIVDNNRNFKANTIIEFDKQNGFSRQNYLVTSSDKLLFRNYLKLNESATITYSGLNYNIIKVSYYKHITPLPIPPFSPKDTTQVNYTPDSIFYIKKDSSDRFKLQPDKTGIYHLQTDSSNKEGLTLFVFENNHFPEIKTTQDMLLTMRYITSKEEYDNIENSSNIKLSIENFWLNTVSNDKEKARIVIRKYYARVQNANENFTSYTQGWKTDRGMIYIVLGKPNSIYKEENSETWVYNEDSNTGSLSLTFDRVNTPFSNNHYILQRSGLYRQSWVLAVDVWRTGRSYFLDE